MRKRWISWILFLCFFIFSISLAFAEPSLVYDQAGLMSSEEVEKLQVELERINEKYEMDFIIITTDDAQGKKPLPYGDDFYEGIYGINHDGGYFLMDMDNSEVTVSFSGRAMDIITDGRQETILDKVFPYMGDGDYNAAAESFIDSAEYYCEQGVPEGQVRVEQEKNYSFKEAAIAAISGLAVGGGFYGTKKRNYRFVPKKNYFSLISNSDLTGLHLADQLMDTRRYVRTIPKPTMNGPSSDKVTTTYRTSRGGTRSGKSRKF